MLSLGFGNRIEYLYYNQRLNARFDVGIDAMTRFVYEHFCRVHLNLIDECSFYGRKCGIISIATCFFLTNLLKWVHHIPK